MRALAIVCAIGLSACTGADRLIAPSAPGSRPPFPLITNRGGHLLSPLRLVVVVAANDDLRDSLFMFADSLVASSWWQQAASAYGVSAIAPVHVTGATLLGSNLTSSQMQDYISASIANSASLAPDGRSLYLLYLPTGVSFAGDSACTAPIGTGYHSPFGTNDSWAVVQRCQGGFHSVLEDLTVVGSHEVVEAASDPMGTAWGLVPPSDPWTANPWATLDGAWGEENGDFCIGTRYREGAFYYQRFYANAAVNAGGDPCIPRLSIPYYNVSTPQVWYTASGTIQIPVTGWATDTVGDWLVNAFVAEHGYTGTGVAPASPTVSLTGATDSLALGSRYIYAINSGRALTLHVSMLSGSPGAWATIKISSIRYDANGQRPPAGDDYAHYWTVGVYVPFGLDALHH